VSTIFLGLGCIFVVSCESSHFRVRGEDSFEQTIDFQTVLAFLVFLFHPSCMRQHLSLSCSYRRCMLRLSAYEAEVAQLRNAQPELKQLREQNRILNDRILEMSRQFEELESQLPTPAPSVSSAHPAEQRIAQLESELVALKHQLHQHDMQHEEGMLDCRTQAAAEQEKLRGANADLLRELAEAQTKLKQLETNLGVEKDALLLELRRKSTQQMAELQKEIAFLNNKLMDTQKQNAELNALMDQPRTSQGEVKRMLEREAELRSVIGKLLKAEESTEGAFTCLACMSIYRKPVTCIPCGHSFCTGCIQAAGHCTQCGPTIKVTYYPNDLLDSLTSKYVFRKQTLASLKMMDPALAAAGAKR
jgi:hypothetical protein